MRGDGEKVTRWSDSNPDCIVEVVHVDNGGVEYVARQNKGSVESANVWIRSRARLGEARAGDEMTGGEMNETRDKESTIRNYWMVQPFLDDARDEVDSRLLCCRRQPFSSTDST
jgi:hypothetical protein